MGELIGLDIGTSKVKMVELVRKKSGFALKKLAVVPIPFGIIEAGSILQRDEVTRAIKTAMKKGFSGKRVIAAVAAQSVMFRHIKCPNMDDDALRSSIQWEVEKYIPYPLEQAVIDYQVINRPVNLAEEMDVMIVASQESIIDDHVLAIKDAGLNPTVIDIQPFALLRSLGMEDPLSQGETASGKSVALLDIGAGTSDLVIFKDSVLKFMRIIPIAGYRFTSAIAKAFNISDAEAEKKKSEDAVIPLDVKSVMPNDASAEGRLFNAFRPVLEEFLLELKRSFDYYKLQNRGDEVNEVIITGGGSKFRNLNKFLENELVVKTKVGDPLDYLEVNVHRHDYEQLREISPMLSVSIGLAQRGDEK
ncbi:MAG: type IV pilus assembly protein PilM [Bacillota bacterium]